MMFFFHTGEVCSSYWGRCWGASAVNPRAQIRDCVHSVGNNHLRVHHRYSCYFLLIVLCFIRQTTTAILFNLTKTLLTILTMIYMYSYCCWWRNKYCIEVKRWIGVEPGCYVFDPVKCDGLLSCFNHIPTKLTSLWVLK